MKPKERAMAVKKAGELVSQGKGVVEIAAILDIPQTTAGRFVEEAKAGKCGTCRYRSDRPGTNQCDYMVLTGRRRGCPSGPGCTRYKKSAARKRIAGRAPKQK